MDHDERVNRERAALRAVERDAYNLALSLGRLSAMANEALAQVRAGQQPTNLSAHRMVDVFTHASKVQAAIEMALTFDLSSSWIDAAYAKGAGK